MEEDSTLLHYIFSETQSICNGLHDNKDKLVFSVHVQTFCVH